MKLSVAPMMDVTDRHCRYFHRLLSPHAVLYTEMITSMALVKGNRVDFLRFSAEEQPVVLQLGGSDPAMLAEAAAMGVAAGYREINLNCGCPSDRVQAGRFGACLMREPETVAACVRAMRAAVPPDVPITVKTRLGVDAEDSYDFLRAFIEPVAAAGAQHFILHARKAYLKGLSPKQNRTRPPVNYERVYQVKRDYPALLITLNGEVKTIADAERHLPHVDGVMIGREAWHNPYILAEFEQALYGTPLPTREAIMADYSLYARNQLKSGALKSALTRAVLGLYKHQPNGKNRLNFSAWDE